MFVPNYKLFDLLVENGIFLLEDDKERYFTPAGTFVFSKSASVLINSSTATATVTITVYKINFF